MRQVFHFWKLNILLTIIYFKKRFITIDDKKWFNQTFEKSVASNLGTEYSGRITQEPYFVNFLRDDYEQDEENLLNHPIKQVENIDLVPKNVYEEVRMILFNSNFMHKYF